MYKPHGNHKPKGYNRYIHTHTHTQRNQHIILDSHQSTREENKRRRKEQKKNNKNKPKTI